MEPNLNTNLLRENVYDCDICEDTKSIIIDKVDPLSKIPVQYAKPCVCKQKERLKAIESAIPPLYENASLETLEPWVHKHAKQASVLQVIKNNPFDSYLFVGKSGVGKSYISYALWKNAAVSGRRVVSGTAAEYYEDFKRLEISRNESWKPRVVGEDLKQKHTPYTILIDEVEKFKVTEFSMEKFFDILKAVADYKHQLLVTSQLSEKALKDHFETLGEAWGTAIVRRLVENVTVVEFW